MAGKILITALLGILAVPVIGAFYGLVFGLRAEKYVYPSVLAAWGVIIYKVWF